MVKKYQHLTRNQRPLLFMALLLVNGALAVAVLLWWTAVSPIIGDPLRWATSRAMAAYPALLDYPFNLLWTLPAAGAGMGWIVSRAGHLRLARRLAAAPILFIAVIVGWYYIAPIDWR